MNIIIACAALLIILAVGLRFAVPHGVTRDEFQNTPIAEITPGLVVFGYVRNINGTGVENVSIYRSYSSYAGVLIATTDTSGYYRSNFYYIPGDEMVTVWADRSGLEFEPKNYYWRHYYGTEQAERNFLVKSP